MGARLLGLALLVPACLTAGSFQPYVRLDARAAYGSVSNDQSNWFAVGNLTAVPAWKATDKLVLLPLMSVTSAFKDRAVGEEDPFVTKVLFLGKPTVKYSLGDWEPRAWGSARRAITSEVVGGLWSKGKYDYEEFGGGAGLDYKKGLGSLVSSLGLGGEWHHRNYQNFRANGAQITQNKNYYYKDYDGWKLALDLDAGKGLPWLRSLGYSLLFKNYPDAYNYAPDGQIDLKDLREDQLHQLKLEGGLGLGSAFLFRAELAEYWNQSDSDHFDSTANKYVEDFNGYWATVLEASLTWALRGLKEKESPTLTLLYRGESRSYTGRPVRNPDGGFTQGKQADMDHLAGLEGRWPLASLLAIVGGGSFRSVQSNQAYSPGVKPTFDLTLLTLGVELKL